MSDEALPPLGAAPLGPPPLRAHLDERFEPRRTGADERPRRMPLILLLLLAILLGAAVGIATSYTLRLVNL